MNILVLTLSLASIATLATAGKTSAETANRYAEASPASSGSGEKPNIIFIMADDLGYGQVGAYGQTEIQTPCIDRMADQGLLLTDYYAGTAVCAPSRCALMTGQHVGHTYIRGNYEIKATEQHESGQLPIPDETITVAEKLKEADYATACIGKWGLGYPLSEGDPLNQGFDFFYGYNCQRHAHSYYPKWLWRNHDKVSLGERDTVEGYSHYRLTTEARKFIVQNKNQPFFLYLAYTIPHSHIQIPATDPNFTQYLSKDWPAVQKRLAGMISLMDQDVGGILNLLKDLQIDENTLVIFTSDNGAATAGGVMQDFFKDSGPLRGIKRNLYEGGTRVPFIAHWPGVIEAGRRSDHIGAHWDLMATACEMAGVNLQPGTDSVSYLPLLRGDLEKQAQHDYVYFELHWPTKRAVRQGNWVALQENTSSFDPNVNPIELYNLEDDLMQQKNLSTSNPKKIDHFKKLLKEAHTPNEHFVFGQGRPNKKKK
jgi:arylsulfatase A-like enzyme